MILAFALIGGVVAFGYSTTRPPQYASTASIFFQVAGADNAGSLLQGSNYAQSQVRSYAVLAERSAVLEPVITRLGLNQSVTSLARQIRTSIPLDTVIIDITAEAGSAKEAQTLAQAVVEQLGATVEDISGANAGQGSQASVDARVVGPASLPRWPFSPNTKRTTLLGLIAGLALGVAVAVVLELMNNRVSDARVLASQTDLPLLGEVPMSGPRPQPQPVPTRNVRQMEAYRRAAANLDFVNHTGDVRALVITSANAAEGKSTLAANLALVLSESRRVLLMDADLRNPRLAERLGLEAAIGITTVITGRAQLADVVQSFGDNLDVVTAGPTPPNPVNMIGSDAFAEMLDEARASYDLVILDAAPLLPVTDSALLAKVADGAILAVNSRRTTRSQLNRATEHLRLAGASVFGVVLTMTRIADKDGGGYYRSASNPPVELPSAQPQ